MTAPLLDAEGVAKSFGAVRAISNASLTVERGEVVALLGANGAGKSTFVKILAGALRPDGGRVNIRGREARVGSPTEARKSGLIPVFQEPSLIPDLDVSDNLKLGDTPAGPFMHWARELGLDDLKFDAMIGQLPLASLRIIDLARALASEPDLLLLDEMTAALPTDLVDRVIRVVRRQAQDGKGVIFISHRFSEIAALCDRASVLRDGTTVGDIPIEPGIEDRVVEMMLGTRIDPAVRESAGAGATIKGMPRLAVKHLAAGAKLQDVSFDLHAGEVLGVVALEVQGQDDLFDALAGFMRPASGSIEVDGRPVEFSHPADAIANGLSLVPGNRAEALLKERSVPGEHRPAFLGALPFLGPAAIRP